MQMREPIGHSQTSAGTKAQAGAVQMPSSSAAVPRALQLFMDALQHRRLALGLVLLAWLLSSPALGLGFYLDDYIGRYVYSDLPGADRLRDVLSGGYGVANGVPEDTHWQIEQGYAPWWTYPHLLLALMRPVGMAAHWLDMALWPDSAVLMRLHSFVWLGLLIVLFTSLARRLQGVLVGGMAALLFAVDHTHGFVAGYITNRHAIIGAAFAVACFDWHVRARAGGGPRAMAVALVCYGLALLSSEASVSIVAYLIGYALFVESGPARRRVLGLVPYVVVTLAWRAYYSLSGYGAHGSGSYIDPLGDPWTFVQALIHRVPLLLTGLFMAPPAELDAVASDMWRPILYVWSLLVVVLLVWSFGPLLKRHRSSRMWAFGMCLSLIPASATLPHNRQLLFASFGGMALLAQAWHLFAVELHGRVLPRALRWSGRVAAVFFGTHLMVSPLVLPLTTSASGLLGPLQRGIATVGDTVAGKDVVFVTAPDYLTPKVVLFSRRVRGEALPHRTRTLSFGPVPLVVQRADERTLLLDYEGGILQNRFLQLYRDRRLPMAVGDRVQLRGLSIEVLRVSSDGRATRVRFSFDRRLDDDQFQFYVWGERGFSEWHPPPVGQRVRLPPAELQFALE